MIHRPREASRDFPQRKSLAPPGDNALSALVYAGGFLGEVARPAQLGSPMGADALGLSAARAGPPVIFLVPASLAPVVVLMATLRAALRQLADAPRRGIAPYRHAALDALS